MSFNQARLRRLNAAPIRGGADYVLYWMQAYRRLERNHALDYAAHCANELSLPLVVYEGLRLDYPRASRRLHRFVLEGMQANAASAGTLGLNYWPFVETPRLSGRGLLRRLSARAALVVTDDFPCFVAPGQSAALARASDAPVFAVDSNSIVPLSLLGAPTSSAAQLRRRIHKAFAEAWPHRARRKPRLVAAAARRVEPDFETFFARDLDAFVAGLPIDPAVPAVADTRGGSAAARLRLRAFVKRRLAGYAERRSQPAPLKWGHASGLSPYLHFGHIGIEEVVEAVLLTTGAWDPGDLHLDARGRREGFFCDDPDVNAFLDQAVTWRDVGYHWQAWRRNDALGLAEALPAWALGTLLKHARDARAYRYSPEQWEAGQTHDPLWNAAQRELVATGTIHGYLRMLWGKKVLEWSESPSQAYQTLLHLNDTYALDGRDPNSYSGILWCFGLFDRPWPERPVLGTIRYMSSENTARKFDLKPYLRYVESLPTIEAVRNPAARRASGAASE